MNKLKVVDISNNLGDTKSLITHPASSTHSNLTAKERAAVGITDGLLRISVGLEDIDDLISDGYKSIFIGTGVWKPNSLRIKGETLGHVHFAINYLTNPDVYDLGENVIIIGAGNSAMDVARTVIRKGAFNVTVY